MVPAYSLIRALIAAGQVYVCKDDDLGFTLVQELDGQQVVDVALDPNVDPNVVLALIDDGRVFGVGDNSRGALGLGNHVNSVHS